ncbi:cyclin-D3-3 [Tripterygium wilfordii]|uniref:B-like cyclin n=1 Tax=Tripterygium wilfordii TaxID=458696 RepID=A0A7J7E2W5_TRIWF|nr:cyclin-D3-2 [Tripterygium wilfordii]KAF5752873.1 cyclin-D3-3 [Tripterygium wilfordii]
MALQEEQTQYLQNAQLIFDGLYCQEESFEENENCGSDNGYEQNVGNDTHFALLVLEHDVFWEDEELLSLISKEKQSCFCLEHLPSDGSLMVARREAIEWILGIKAHYGFTALTTVLAVNYFDRFISRFKFQSDKPWMGQLIAVACLSLAAKVEETQVPLLLDLQVVESKYVFEAKTIQRMELLVLSTLQWKMNSVTPISFFDHIIRRLGLRNHLHLEFLWRCERLLLSTIPDSRFVSYLPSVLAAATMLHVVEEIEPCNPVKYQNQLIEVLKTNEDDVKECYKAILEITGSQNNKRKHLSDPDSPSGVIDASFSCDSSNDSWAVASSSNSPLLEPRFKRRRVNDQQMRLPSLNRMFVDVITSPY